MNWRDLPSLASLRAFEAAARTGSFSAAARELNVTHAAIAQHVRQLEDRFGQQLMQRNGNAMSVTPGALALSEALTEGFGRVAAAVRDFAAQDTGRALRVALTPSFAVNWLLPRLGRFWGAHPEVALELLPSTAILNLRTEAIDLAIRYGRGPWSGLRTEPLISAGHVAVSAPGPQPATLAELAGRTWLLDGHRSEEVLWAASQGIDLDAETVRSFDTAEMVLQAARSGLGIAILPRPVVADDLAAGRLVELCAESGTALAYHLVTRPETTHPGLRTLIRWLRAEAEGMQP